MTAKTLTLLALSLTLLGAGCASTAPEQLEPAVSESMLLDDGTGTVDTSVDTIEPTEETPVQAEPVAQVPSTTVTPVPTTPTPAPVKPESVVRVFDIKAEQWSFSPSTITVNQGEKVILNITSVDVEHGFALSAFGIKVDLVPNKTERVEFVADKKGTFTFFCSVFCGSGHGSMKGSLIVQ